MKTTIYYFQQYLDFVEVCKKTGRSALSLGQIFFCTVESSQSLSSFPNFHATQLAPSFLGGRPPYISPASKTVPGSVALTDVMVDSSRTFTHQLAVWACITPRSPEKKENIRLTRRRDTDAVQVSNC